MTTGTPFGWAVSGLLKSPFARSSGHLQMQLCHTASAPPAGLEAPSDCARTLAHWTTRGRSTSASLPFPRAVRAVGAHGRHRQSRATSRFCGDRARKDRHMAAKWSIGSPSALADLVPDVLPETVPVARVRSVRAVVQESRRRPAARPGQLPGHRPGQRRRAALPLPRPRGRSVRAPPRARAGRRAHDVTIARTCASVSSDRATSVAPSPWDGASEVLADELRIRGGVRRVGRRGRLRVRDSGESGSQSGYHARVAPPHRRAQAGP